LAESREISLIYEDKLTGAGSFTKYRYRASTNEEMDGCISLINNTAGSERKAQKMWTLCLGCHQSWWESKAFCSAKSRWDFCLLRSALTAECLLNRIVRKTNRNV